MQFLAITNILKSSCGSVFYAYCLSHILLVFNDSSTIDGVITRGWKASGNFGSAGSLLLSFSAWLSLHWHAASVTWFQLYTLFFLPFIKNKPRFLGESISFPELCQETTHGPISSDEGILIWNTMTAGGPVWRLWVICQRKRTTVP